MFSRNSCLIICLTVGIVGCSSFNGSTHKSNHAASTKVYENAMLAIEHCGKGNIRTVNTSTFTCKK